MLYTISNIYTLSMYLYLLLILVLWFFKISARSKIMFKEYSEANGCFVFMIISSTVLNLIQAFINAIANQVVPPFAFYVNAFVFSVIAVVGGIIWLCDTLSRVREKLPER